VLECLTVSLWSPWEARIERLRPTWSERAVRLKRLLRLSRILLPAALAVMAGILVMFWNSAPLRTLRIAYLAISVYAFLYTFYWLLPRQREIFLVPFDEFVARRRRAPRSSFMTPRALLSGGLKLAAMGLLLVGLFFGFALAFRGGDPRTTYSFVGAGLVFDGFGSLLAIPAYRRADATLIGRSSTQRLLIAAIVAVVLGALLWLAAYI